MPLKSFFYVSLVLLLAACSTIVHESKQSVMINSNPQGATLTIDNQRYTTPAMVSLKGASEYPYTIEKQGYQTAQGKVDGEFRVWSTVVGNIFNLTGLIGFATDYWGTKTAYELQKDNVVTLTPLPAPVMSAPVVDAPAPMQQPTMMMPPASTVQPSLAPQQPTQGLPPMAPPRYIPYTGTR